MDMREMGGTGIKVSEIGMGCIQITRLKRNESTHLIRKVQISESTGLTQHKRILTLRNDWGSYWQNTGQRSYNNKIHCKKIF